MRMPLSEALGRGGELIELISQLRLRSRLELPRALAAYAELTAEGGKRNVFIREDPLLDDQPCTSIEDIHRLFKAFPELFTCRVALIGFVGRELIRFERLHKRRL